MKFEGYDFEYVGTLTPVKTADGGIHLNAPQTRYKNEKNLPLNRYGGGSFCRFKIPSSWRRAGVYLMIVDDNILYVGETENLTARFNNGYGNISPRNCFKGGQETNCRLNSLILSEVRNGKMVELWFHKTDEFKEAERNLRNIVQGPWNRV